MPEPDREREHTERPMLAPTPEQSAAFERQQRGPVGLTYEGDERKCNVHGGYEMEHTCAGGSGEPLGYCSAWDGENRPDKHWLPTCDFATERQEPPK